MIVDLITEEIRTHFPQDGVLRVEIPNYQYNLHCSQQFAVALFKCFMNKGFMIPNTITEDMLTPQAVQDGTIRFTKYQVPNLGTINVLTDMDQGYRIQKVPNYKEGQIVKRDLRSRQSWILRELEGTLMAVPIQNKYFPDTDPIEITPDMIVLAEARGNDFNSDNIWNQ